TAAVQRDRIREVHDLLLQMGKTPFKSQNKPTPMDEAEILIHYLQTIFYPAYTQIQNTITQTLKLPEHFPAVIELGFWPGGDRDGNPNVTADITLAVALKLKNTIIEIYQAKIEELKRRLTFKN